MARINTGAIISEIRGSVKDQTYSRNAGGAYVKGKLIQTNPNTTYQQTYREYFKNISAAWKGLSDENRNAWIAEGLKTNPKSSIQSYRKQAGFNCFVSRNVYPYFWNGVVQVEPVETGLQNPLQLINPNFSYPSFKMEIYGRDDTGEWLAWIKTTPPLSPGIMSLNWSLLTFYTAVQGDYFGHDLTIQPYYSTRYTFPISPVGQAVWVQAVYTSTITGKIICDSPIKGIFTN